MRGFIYKTSVFPRYLHSLSWFYRSLPFYPWRECSFVIEVSHLPHLKMLSLILLVNLFSYAVATPVLAPLRPRQVTVVEVLAGDPNNPIATWTVGGPSSAPTLSPNSSPSPSPSPSPSASSAPVSSPSTSNDGSPLSDGRSLLSTINYWRNEYGLSNLAWNTTLQGVAQNTGSLDNGCPCSETHHPIEPTAGHGTGEVIAAGSDSDGGGKWDTKGHSPFEIAYMAWLCEGPASKLGANGQDLCDLVMAVSPW